MTRRLTVPTPTHGWDHPWPNLFELAAVFRTDNWTLIGGLMVHAHALAHNVPVNRPTEDVDVMLHVEVVTGVASEATVHLEKLGYELQQPANRRGPAYRFTRGDDVIDVMIPDNTGRIKPVLRRNPMFTVEGGKQALQRPLTLTLRTGSGPNVELNVPDELGALVLKGAAHLHDKRERERHLFDAATLAACITDHAAELARLKGSDVKRLRHLADALADRRHPAWLSLPERYRIAGQDTLRILTAGRGTPPREGAK
jgi:hypothetical protein